MKCPKCDFENPAAAKFCQECGAALGPAQGNAEQQARLRTMRAFIPESLAERIRNSKGQLEGDRRFVTVMFADVSGFTAMSELLDPEEVTTIMNECFKDLVEIIYRYEGTIDKFIGDCIMAIWGAPVAHEDDPERAVRSALEMMQAIGRFNTEQRIAPPGLMLHIGINSGWVIAGAVGTDQRMDYTVMGDTVNLASRLESAAQRGQVFISQRTGELVKEAIALRVVGPLALKGKREPVPAFEATGVLDRAGTGRVLAVQSELVGREQELAVLKNGFTTVRRTKAGRAVFIAGDAGLGKSRLSEEFGNHARHAGAAWLVGRCLSYGGAMAYGPFLAMIKDIYAIAEFDTPDEIRNKVRGKTTELFGERTSEVYPYLITLLSLSVEEEFQIRVQYLEPQALKMAQFCAVRDLLLELGRETTTVVCLEDWHWCDAASAELLGFILDSLTRGELYLLCSLRPDKESAGYRSMELASRQLGDRTEAIHLQQLGNDHSMRLIGQLIPGMPQRLKDLILTKTGGNPFFIEEIIRSLRDKGTIRQDGGAWRLDTDTSSFGTIDIPDRVELLISSRISRLAQDARNVLQAAATVGLGFGARIVGALLEVPEAVDRELRLLEERDFIIKQPLAGEQRPGYEYRFKHPLIQAAAYSEILKKQRRVYHLRVGRFIEANYQERLEEQYGMVAYHYKQAEEWGKALEYYQKTAKWTRRECANQQAIDGYRKTIEILKGRFPDRKDDLFSATMSLGFMYELVGEWGEAMTAIKNSIDIARELGNQQFIGRAHLNLGVMHFEKGDRDKAIELYNYSLAIFQQLGDRRWIGDTSMYLGAVYSAKGEHQRAIDLFTAQLVIARESADQRGIGLVSGELGAVYYEMGDSQRAVELFNDCLRISRELGDKRRVAYASRRLGNVYQELGDYQQAVALLTDSMAVYRELGDKQGIGVCHVCLGIVSQDHGDYERAFELYNQYLAIVRELGDKGGTEYAYGCLASAHLDLGDDIKANELLAQAVLIAEEIGDRTYLVGYYQLLVKARLRSASNLTGGRPALIAEARQYAQRALALAEELHSKDRLALAYWTYGMLYGETDAFDLAEGSFTKAIAMYSDQKQTKNLADACCDYAAMLQKKGDRSKALEQYARAVELYQAIQLNNKVKDVEREVTDLRATAV